MPIKKKNAKQWVWEFSKRVVIAYTVFYFLIILFVCFAIFYSENYESLESLITNINETFRTCVFGYFVKAGVENVYKITRKLKTDDTE